MVQPAPWPVLLLLAENMQHIQACTRIGGGRWHCITVFFEVPGARIGLSGVLMTPGLDRPCESAGVTP